MGRAIPRGPVPASWTARFGFAPPYKGKRWMAYVATLLRARGLDDQVIHPHGLSDRRTDADVGEESGTGVGGGRWRD
jgi:hypothetical protein